MYSKVKISQKLKYAEKKKLWHKFYEFINLN